MKKEIKILVVADSPAAVVRIKRALNRAGLSILARRVETSDEFREELNCHLPDVVLANHGPPGFDDRTALALAGEKRPDIPCILVTDAPAEAAANGEAGGWANHRTILSSPLARLAPTVRRAVREARRQTRLHDLELRALTARWFAR
jgi:DNA-binding NtrC family response regulator